MQLSPRTDKALNHWLGVPTWHTNHLDDLNRWFDVIDQYQREHGYDLDEPDMRQEIANRVSKGGSLYPHLQDIIRDRVSLAGYILLFLKHTRR